MKRAMALDGVLPEPPKKARKPRVKPLSVSPNYKRLSVIAQLHQAEDIVWNPGADAAGHPLINTDTCWRCGGTANVRRLLFPDGRIGAKRCIECWQQNAWEHTHAALVPLQ